MLVVRAIAVLVLLSLAAGARAGLYYSGEQLAELPSQWRGFLLDQRLLRGSAVKPSAGVPATPARERYQRAAAAALSKTAQQRQLTADESADLGALYARLGEIGKALATLRAAQRRYPRHFHIAANLGTAWQMHGDLDQAATWLEQAVKLAPPAARRNEEYHLKLVRFRKSHARDTQQLDDLFGVRYVGEKNDYGPGALAAAERKKLPSDAVAIVQQLALWLPADGRLLWQLAELANAYGDVRTAAAIMDGCVSEFGMHAPDLRAHRRVLRAAADELAKAIVPKAAHETHAGLFRPRSKRPLVTKLNEAALPPIQADGVNQLPWSVLADTTVGRNFHPNFPRYVRDLNGKRVALSGFMQPLAAELEVSSFMLIEYPVGCWYCEMPDVNGIVFVEMPPGKRARYTRGLVKVEGTLSVNDSDPENFLFTVKNARVAEPD